MSYLMWERLSHLSWLGIALSFAGCWWWSATVPGCLAGRVLTGRHSPVLFGFWTVDSLMGLGVMRNWTR